VPRSFNPFQCTAIRQNVVFSRGFFWAGRYALRRHANTIARLVVVLLRCLLFTLLLAGCNSAKTVDPFGLRTVDLVVGGVPLKAEVAEDEQSRAMGLMFRDSLSEDHGMLFIFDQPRQASFWMKNTKIPLSIAFLEGDRAIKEEKSMRPYDETLIQSRSDKISYAIEVNAGWFDRHQVKSGAKVDGIP
jgi:uncharacterized protein